MAWIESHTNLMRHRKVADLARELGVRRSHAVGHLHALWHAVMEQQEDGDLERWSDDFIAENADYDGDGAVLVQTLQRCGWLDERVLHDWLDYAGKYLIRKYASSNVQRLREIWAKHGRSYGGDHQAQLKRPISDRLVTKERPSSEPTNLPTNHNQPTNQPKGENGQDGWQEAEPAWKSATLPENLRSDPSFVAAWEKYCTEMANKKKHVSVLQARMQLQELSAWGPVRATAAIECSLRQGWTGIFEPNQKRGTNADAGARLLERVKAAQARKGTV